MYIQAYSYFDMGNKIWWDIDKYFIRYFFDEISYKLRRNKHLSPLKCTVFSMYVVVRWGQLVQRIWMASKNPDKLIFKSLQNSRIFLY